MRPLGKKKKSCKQIMDKINTYEEARKQRLHDNNKRFEDLGILKIAKSLSNLTTPEKKCVQQQQQRRLQKSRSENNIYSIEPRRSCRVRNPVLFYRDDDLDIELPPIRKRSKISSSWASYIARPLNEIKTASYEERAKAMKCADSLQSKLSFSAENPSFVKSMVRSHVYSCFWLGLPSRFCEDYLPKDTVEMVLEDEEGEEYNAVYIGKRAGLSGGWRGFALEHKLDDGDALIFQLVQPQRFKVYIVRACDCWNGGDKQQQPPEAKTKKEEEDELVVKTEEKTAKNSTTTRRTSTRKKNKICN